MTKLTPSEIIDRAIADAARKEAEAAQAVTVGAMALYECLKAEYGIQPSAAAFLHTSNLFNDILADLADTAAKDAAAAHGITILPNTPVNITPDARKALVGKALEVGIELMAHRQRMKAQGR